MGLPGCPTSCGNVTVPYPFGIGANCSFSAGFDLTCDHASNPPRLFVDIDRVQVTNISLDEATVRVAREVVVNITFDTTLDHSSFGWGFLGGGRAGPLVLAFGRNDFFVTGCNVQATLHELN